MATCASPILDRADVVSRDPEDDPIHVSGRLVDLDGVQRHYLLSLEERRGVHLSAIGSDYDERNVTTILALT